MFAALKQGICPTDHAFDSIYPQGYRLQSARHFTPVRIAAQAARFLARKPEDRILDIGSGSGKFCFVGSALTGASFYGVEQREQLTLLCQRIAKKHKLKQAYFLNADFSEMAFSGFNGIYFFNSFQEYMDDSCVLDESSQVSLDTYKRFHQSLKDKLGECLPGTRLVTYYTFRNRIPSCFRLVKTGRKDLLKFYIRK